MQHQATGNPCQLHHTWLLLNGGTNGCGVIQPTAITHILGARETLLCSQRTTLTRVLCLFTMKLLENFKHSRCRQHMQRYIQLKQKLPFVPLQAPVSCAVCFSHGWACCSDCGGGCVLGQSWFVSSSALIGMMSTSKHLLVGQGNVVWLRLCSYIKGVMSGSTSWGTRVFMGG